jgi:hypothetical protein
LTAGWVPRRLAVAGTLLHSFDSVHRASKASLVLKLGVERRRLLPKLVGWFNHRKNRWKIASHGVLGFLFWQLEIGVVGAPFYRGVVLMSYPEADSLPFYLEVNFKSQRITTNRKGEDLMLEEHGTG